MPTTPVPWKGLTQVNSSDGQQSQANAQVTSLPNGGYLVVWTDSSNVHNPGGTAIVGQIYNAYGEKVGGEVLLSKLKNGHQADATQPATTTLADGTVAVAFVDLSIGPGAIEVQIFDPTLTTLLRTDEVTSTNGLDPSLVPIPGGGYAVAFTRPATTDDVIVQFVGSGGGVGDPIEIFPSVVEQGHSELTALANGNLVAVYQATSFGTAIPYSRFAIITPDGSLIGADAIPGTNQGVSDVETRPNVAALKGGGFVVAWTSELIDGDGTGIRATIYNDLGNIVNNGVGHAGILVNTTTSGNQNDASIVALADGGFLVAWEDEDFLSVGVARGQRFDSSGAKVGKEFVLNYSVTPDSTEAALRMVLLADGRVAFVAHSTVGADFDVVTAIWDPRDGTISGANGGDVLTSAPGGGSLRGFSGDDTLVGLGGPDLLAGGTGNDSLTGGAGPDRFLFDTAFSKTSNVDTLTDFVAADDTILLDNSIFKKLKTEGPLKGKYFEIGKKADDKNDFIVYNKKWGDLFYDRNGDKKGGAVKYAVLDGSPDDLSKADFLVI